MSDSEENSPEIKKLPILKYRNEIVKKIRDNPVVIISGLTGCGKTTKVPQFIYDDAVKNNENCSILISQPRKIAAIRIAERVVSERKCELGKLVGYQVGLRKKVDDENHETKILFCTTGVILEKLIHDKGMNKYSHIIIDECHERDIDVDLLMTIIREFLLDETSDTKLIIMSATLNPDTFVKYFTLKLSDKVYVPAVVIMEMERDYQIDIKYLDDLAALRISSKIINYNVPSITSEMLSLAAKLIILFLRRSTKSILVFLPGIYEIESLHGVLENCKDLKEKCLVCFLHSSLPTTEQRQTFIPATLPKVILSTNIAESSVTIPNIGCVIDFCLTKNIVRDESSLSSLKLEWTTKQSCTQRAGRTGRVCDGEVYRLVNEQFHNRIMFEGTIPEMVRAPLENVILRVKQLNREPPTIMINKCPSPPKMSRIMNSILVLKELGALTIHDENGEFDVNDGDLTYIGHIMSALPLDMHITKLIILGYTFSIVDECIIIAAGLNVKSIFKNHFDRKMEDYSMKLDWANGSSCDLIATLNAYKFWQHERERGKLRKFEDELKWCDNMNLERKCLHEMRVLIHDINRRLRNVNLEPLQDDDKIIWSEMQKQLIIKICVAGAFIPNYFIQGNSDEDIEREAFKTLCGLNPNNSIYFRKMERNCIGEVYVEQIKNNLVECGIIDTKDETKITFDSSKILVEFGNSSYMIDDGNYDNTKLHTHSTMIPGNISKEIYKAVFYRQNTITKNKLTMKRYAYNKNSSGTFNFKVMHSEDEEKYAIQHGIGERIDGIFKLKKNYISEAKYCCLPSFNTLELYGKVTHVEHCNKFYFQPIGENQNVLDEVQNYLNNEKIVAIDKPYVDKLVIIIDDMIRKRAKIVNIFEYSNSVECFHFDYGNNIEISISNVFEFEDQETCQLYFAISERCFECKLMEISPSYSKCPRGKWTLEAISDFRQMVMNCVCKIIVYSVVDEKASVTLIANETNMNKFLIDEGYAKSCNESYVSRMNHRERKNVQLPGVDWISREDEFKEKINKMIKIVVPSPSLDKCHKTLSLEGPFSPLETSIAEISLKGYGKIRVDQLSVNHIMLNENIEDNDGKLLVAAEIIKNNSNGSVLHSVSAMPNILGFPEILSMIFAQNVIFYRDPQRSHILGMRFGLGYDDLSGESYFYEHDCILPLNFILTSEDISDINNLRYSMSKLLNGGENTSKVELHDSEKIKLLANIKRLILIIIAKDRKSFDGNSRFAKHYSNINSKWITDDQSDMTVKTDPFKSGYRQINFPPLYEN